MCIHQIRGCYPHKEEIHHGLSYFAASKAACNYNAAEIFFQSKIKSGEEAVYAFMRVNEMLGERVFKSLDYYNEAVIAVKNIAKSYGINIEEG